MERLDKAKNDLKETHSGYSRLIDEKEATHASTVNDLISKFATLEAKHNTTTDNLRNITDTLTKAEQTITVLKATIENLELKLTDVTESEFKIIAEKEKQIKE